MHPHHQRHQTSSLADQFKPLNMGMDSKSRVSLAPLNYNTSSPERFTDIRHSTESKASFDRTSGTGNNGGILNKNGH